MTTFEARVKTLAVRHGTNVTHPEIIDRGYKACARGETELIDRMLAQFGTAWINELSVTEAQVSFLFPSTPLLSLSYLGTNNHFRAQYTQALDEETLPCWRN
jgi:hypothetical protein